MATVTLTFQRGSVDDKGASVRGGASMWQRQNMSNTKLLLE